MNWRFAIEAAEDPQSLPRVLGYFAQRWIVPSGVTMALRDGGMAIDIAVEALDEQGAAIIAAKLRENVLVAHVTLLGGGEAIVAAAA
ncbi:hypothetical protein [Sphingomonas sanxanigenens]|uniref:ACT domain-containing protein n=1 Tax=Sphingomonas sanxanigenens DSM 19645 = NX02 TaxID=1123269 RepID=W0A7T8_9SPHN|nr:hypothetical protein [Sphingomonas sanxanigenens]AHE53974.1 hypothetical protein NX02_11315 [Sphingomonas sanxanigenens DSM 19645 = NX02]